MKPDRAKIAAYQKAYRLRHPDRVAAARRRWREAHKEEDSARRRRYREAHMEQYRAYRRADYRRVPTHVRTALRRKRTYGLPDGWIQAKLIEQGFKCPICDGPVNEQSHVDHNHLTGQLRGMLCGRCNTGLGQFRESEINLTKAVAYLRATR